MESGYIQPSEYIYSQKNELPEPGEMIKSMSPENSRSPELFLSYRKEILEHKNLKLLHLPFKGDLKKNPIKEPHLRYPSYPESIRPEALRQNSLISALGRLALGGYSLDLRPPHLVLEQTQRMVEAAMIHDPERLRHQVEIARAGLGLDRPEEV